MLVYGRRVLDALTGNITTLDDLVCESVGTINALRSDGTDALQVHPLAHVYCRPGIPPDVPTALEEVLARTKCLNLVNAADILRKIWDQGGSSPQWIFNPSKLGHDWLLI